MLFWAFGFSVWTRGWFLLWFLWSGLDCVAVSRSGETLERLVAEQPGRLLVTSSVAAEASLLTVYRTSCHICTIRHDRILSRLALELEEEQRRGRRGMWNHVCLVCPAGGHRVLWRDSDSSRQPQPVRQHCRPAEFRGGSSPADGL